MNDFGRSVILSGFDNVVTKKISYLERKLLPVFRLLYREVFVHRVGREMLEVAELLIALHDPANLKIVFELYRRSLIAHKKVLLQVRVGFTLHESNALDTSALID